MNRSAEMIFALSVSGAGALLAQNPMLAEQKAAYTANKTNLVKAAEKMPVVASYRLRRVPGPSSPETGLPASGLASFPGSEQEFVETPNWRALGRLRVATARRGKS